MASFPPGGVSLDGPPPPPPEPGTAPQAFPEQTTPLIAGTQPVSSPGQISDDVLSVGMEIDKVLHGLSQVAKEGAAEFGQARELLKAGLSKFIAATGGNTSASPVEVGTQFPGGGFGSTR